MKKILLVLIISIIFSTACTDQQSHNTDEETTKNTNENTSKNTTESTTNEVQSEWSYDLTGISRDISFEEIDFSTTDKIVIRDGRNGKKVELFDIDDISNITKEINLIKGDNLTIVRDHSGFEYELQMYNDEIKFFSISFSNEKFVHGGKIPENYAEMYDFSSGSYDAIINLIASYFN